MLDRDIVENIGIDSGTLDFHLKSLFAVNLVFLRRDDHCSFYASTSTFRKAWRVYLSRLTQT